MGEPVEVAIESALLARAQAFATAQAITISLPNVAFTPPEAKKVEAGVTVFGKWLRASFLPAPSSAVTINHDGFNQHYGLMQVDVFYGAGSGELAPGRVASAIIAYFKRGTVLGQDGFTIRIEDTPRRASMLIDGSWAMIPVSIPYRCFARNPA